MADILLRLNKDMLVLSSDARQALERAGIDSARDTELTLLLEPEVVEEVYKLEEFAEPQCWVAPTAGLVPARLRAVGMDGRAEVLAKAALETVALLRPQHVLVEVGPCGLPLDGTSKASLNENCDQYKRAALLIEGVAKGASGGAGAAGAGAAGAGAGAARAAGATDAQAGTVGAGTQFDAFFLNGFARTTDLKCALMGVRKVSDAPIIASVDVLPDGTLKGGKLAAGAETLEDAAVVAAEYGAQAFGFTTAAPADVAAGLAARAAAATSLPLLVQLEVAQKAPEQGKPSPENPYFDAETMVDAADALRAAGVQFLRAVGQATPAYTGALVAATDGLDVEELPEAQVAAAAAAARAVAGCGLAAAGGADGRCGGAPSPQSAGEAGACEADGEGSAAAATTESVPATPAPAAQVTDEQLADVAAKLRARVSAAMRGK